MAGPDGQRVEFQLLDDDNHPNGKKATTRCGSLYDLYAPDEGRKVLKPVGEYNTARVVAQGTKLEHWINGRKVLEVDTASDDWKERVARSKFRSNTRRSGRISMDARSRL